MKVTILQDVLAKALSIVGRAVATRSTLPVLGNILIEARDHMLHLASIKGIDAAEFPIVPTNLDGNHITVDGNELKRMIDLVAFAAATDESRPTLAGVEVTMRDGKLTMAATDGYRLSVQSIAVEDMAEHTAIIPAKSLAELARIIDGGNVEISLAENRVGFSLTADLDKAGTTQGIVGITSSAIDARFPDYRGIIPKHATTTATVKRDALLAAVKVAQLFARDSANIVRLTVNGNITVEATSMESGDGASEIDAVIDGPEVEIAFNARYLIDLLSPLNTDTVKMELTQPNRPGKFTTADDGYLHVVMPMSV
jgi:DNA polymerase-3 subunit beta